MACDHSAARRAGRSACSRRCNRHREQQTAGRAMPVATRVTCYVPRPSTPEDETCLDQESCSMRFSLKPVFIGWLTIISLVPLQLFFTFWAGLFFGALASFFFRNILTPFVPATICAGVAFFGIPLTFLMVKKLNYERTEYRFFDDRLEFEEGFFSRNKKVIMLRDVREVSLRKGLLQRQCSLGSIYLATPATGALSSSNAFATVGFGSVSSSGIIVRDIRDPDQAYARISELIETARHG
jgi:membrane protein YdbS with pleckstrin-like domain